MKAVVSPGFAVNEISFKTYSSAPGYLNETFLNSTYPFLFLLNSSFFSGSFMLSLVSKTSAIR